MGVPPSRTAALKASLDAPVEKWPYLDDFTLLKACSRKVCITCHWFRHHAGVNCIPVPAGEVARAGIAASLEQRQR
jgi:hypothetical protein